MTDEERLHDLGNWSINPKMSPEVDLCTVWIYIGEHWPLIVARSAEPLQLRELGAAIDACCVRGTQPKKENPHPCCKVLGRLQKQQADWPERASSDEHVMAVLTRLHGALTRFCAKFSAA